MKAVSAITHDFCRVEVPGDGSCLYTSFRHVYGCLDTINNQQLRSMVADYIRKNQNLHLTVLQSGTNCKTVEDYCDKIENNNLWGREAEIRALAMLGHILIRLVSMTRTAQGNITINILNYGEDVESFEECVYILYDDENKHYDPVYVINKHNLSETTTIFKRDDETVRDLLDQCIRKELHGDGIIHSGGHNPSYEMELIKKTNFLNETEDIDDRLIPAATTNFPVTQKSKAHHDLSLARTTGIPSSISHDNDVSEIPAKLAKLDAHKPTTFDENDTDPKTVEGHLQTGILGMYQMRFEFDPALSFRGRTRGDFESNGALPRYFTTGRTRQYLNLLIPRTYLSSDRHRNRLEICIVTPEINGRTYINPYFTFKTHPTDPQSPHINPMFITFDDTTELKPFLDELFQQLELKLVVVMLTKNELMQVEQPLKIFPTPANNLNASPITMKYDKHGALKSAYHLREIRFAITLWEKEPGEKLFYRHDDKQYISTISTEDKNTRVRSSN